MALTSQQLEYLRHSDQRFRAYMGVFGTFTLTITDPAVPEAGTALAPTPLPRIDPRYSLASHSGELTIYGTDTVNRDGSYVGDANIVFALDSGAGGVVDNADGTCTYTAPASGNGVDVISMTATNDNGSKTGYAYVKYAKEEYDNITAEIASISGGVDQHGWKMLIRVRGSANAIAQGVGVLIHVEDTWGTTTSTFGGYRYPEGVCFGYVSQRQGYHDGAGEYWTGIEVVSPWWLLERARIEHTWWSFEAQSGSFYLGDFAPADAIHHILNVITDWTERHNLVLWSDQNAVDDFIITGSDLATIVSDVIKRTMGITYCDRYGTLFCVPEPDIRADEYWGTPAPVYTGSEILSESTVLSRTITENAYEVQRLTLEAVDKSNLGIFAISENPTAPGGEVRSPDGVLICDQANRLASWVVQKRASLNRAWSVDVNLPLNHTVDLCSYVDVCFTAVSQVGAPTASGRTWVAQITYRPDIFRGSWQGSWKLLKLTEGDGEAETGGASGWGGSGQWYSGNARYSGSAQDWGTGASDQYWCKEWYFMSAQGDWTADHDGFGSGETIATYEAGEGWKSVYLPSGGVDFGIWRTLVAGTRITKVAISAYSEEAPTVGVIIAIRPWSNSASWPTAQLYCSYESGSGYYVIWEPSGTAMSGMGINIYNEPTGAIWVQSVRLEGFLPSPFGTDNCTGSAS